MSDAKPSATLLRQRIRNRLFEVMRAAATFEGVASVGAFETINGWDDFSQPERFYQPPVFSPDECLAIEAFGRALDHASDATETDVCSAAALSACRGDMKPLQPFWALCRPTTALADLMTMSIR